MQYKKIDGVPQHPINMHKMLRKKPFPKAPNKFKNFVFRELTFWKHLYNQTEYREKYVRCMDEYKTRFTKDEVRIMHNRVKTVLFEMEKERYEKRMMYENWSIVEVESDIHIAIEYDEFLLPDVGFQLLLTLEQWKAKHAKETKEMQAFVQDRQNVHTKVISDQINKSIDILLDTPVPKTQKTLDEIMTAYANELHKQENLQDVYNDMKHWGNTSEIFKPNDYLYRKLLRSLWAKIQTFEKEIRKELLKRLWEESLEATGLCATGHISRLANVLVGFDANFQPPISMQELLQNGMAKISQLDIETDEKLVMARKLMEELRVEESERGPWLDAF